MRERVTEFFGLILCRTWGVAFAAPEMLQGLREASTAACHAIETQDKEHVARNHSNDQRTTFLDDGITVIPATTSLSRNPEQHPGWSWGMHLAGHVTLDTVRPGAKAPPTRFTGAGSVFAIGSKSDRGGELFTLACRHLRPVARELVH